MSTDRELLVQEITQVRFSPVRLREGYGMGEVDRFLDRVVSAAATVDRTPPAYVDAPPAPASPAPVAPTPSVIQEQRGLLSRLFGRG